MIRIGGSTAEAALSGPGRAIEPEQAQIVVDKTTAITRNNARCCFMDVTPLDHTASEGRQVDTLPYDRSPNRLGAKSCESLEIGIATVALERFAVRKRNHVQLMRLGRVISGFEADPSLDLAAVPIHDGRGARLELLELAPAVGVDEEERDQSEPSGHGLSRPIVTPSTS